MWGVPGTLLAARALHARTREERWRAAVEESVHALRDERDDDGLWTQELYGHTGRMLGPIHGFVGNIAALEDTRGAAEVLARTAIVEDGRANWPPALELRAAGRACSGATARPGSSRPRASYLDEELLLAGAELIWDAGPLEVRGEGRRPLPRHRRERLRAAEDVRAHGRRALARPRARVRRCTRSRRSSGCRRATRSSPAASAPRSTRPTASTRGRAFRSSTAWTTREPQEGRARRRRALLCSSPVASPRS